jgi:hypothetical protein
MPPLLPPPPASWPPWMSSWSQQPLAHSFHTKTMVPPVVTDWVTDFGTSNHTTSSAGNLPSVRPPLPTNPSSIIVGNGSSLLVTSVGNAAFSGSFYLNNVLVTPDIIQNLLSVRHFTIDNWCSIEFDPYDLSVKDLSSQNVIARCNSWGPSTRCICLHIPLLHHVLLLLRLQVLMPCPSCRATLVSFAPGAPMIFATLASSVIILACLLPVLCLMQIISLT